MMFWLLSKKNMLVSKNQKYYSSVQSIFNNKIMFPLGSVSTFGITYIENISIEAAPSRAILTH